MRAMLLLLAASLMAAPPVPVIFDTDMGNDIDDALALAMLHALEARGEARLLGVTVTKDNVWAGRYVSAVNTFYGRAALPVGVVRGGKTPEEGNYNRQAIETGKWAYTEPGEEAVALLLRLLAAEADGSVVLVQVGFSTNLARLLEADAGLVKRKVRLLSAMAGHFVTGPAEYNVKIDVAAARKVFGEWPAPIVFSGFEVGRAMKYPALSIENDFGWTARHPVVDGYRHYMKMPYDRETWDLTSVLYAVRPERGYFGVSEPGRVEVDNAGVTTFVAEAAGTRRYLTVDATQRARVLEAFVQLATQPARR